MHLSILMMSRWLRSNSTLSGAAICLALMFSSLLVPSAKPQAPNSSVKGGASLPPAAPSEGPSVKPEPKKAKEAYKRGLRAEQAGDWKTAHEDYSDAVDWAPTEREYLLRREVAKSHQNGQQTAITEQKPDSKTERKPRTMGDTSRQNGTKQNTPSPLKGHSTRTRQTLS